MRFSQRTAWDLDDHAFSAKVHAARASGRDLIDLTVSNPTACGFNNEVDLAPLSHAEAMLYDPEPLGMMSARQSVAGYYRDHGAEVPPDRICLTTSTSEAYSFLFRLLCDPGDEVLVASPSYPLFDYIARLDDVKLVEYPLLYDPHAAHGWFIDLHTLGGFITPRTRAILVVHPNNPTGHFSSVPERLALEAFCVKRGLCLIVDEVFLDYALEGKRAETFAGNDCGALTFVLSGISKVCGLPQMKCSWIIASGPDAQVAPAMARLEVIADTFLSMNAPVQHALPGWLAARKGFQQQVRSRIAENLAALDAALVSTSCERLTMDAGWTAILRVPRVVNDVPFAEAALERGVIVQPGEFYGLPEGRAVLSLLTPPAAWGEGLARLPSK